MAWSESDISSEQNGWFDDDKPFIVPLNVMGEIGAGSVKWVDSGNTDRSQASSPTSRVYDGLTSLLTEPSTTDTTWYLEVRCVADQVFDTLCIMNRGNLNAASSISLEVADDTGFSTNLTQIDTISVGSSNRAGLALISPTTGNRAQVTARFFRIKIVFSGATTPQAHEIILGRRRQLKHNPFVPWDPDQRISEVISTQSLSGINVDYVRFRGKAVFSGEIVTGGDSNREADIKAIWDDSYDGTRNMVFCPKPSSAINNFFLCRLGKEFNYPYQGPYERRWAFNLEEQGPHFRSSEV